MSESERQELVQLNKYTVTGSLRAKIILRAAEGSSNGKIAEELGISIEMSRLFGYGSWTGNPSDPTPLRRRWRELSVGEIAVGERLKDADRIDRDVSSVKKISADRRDLL